MTLLPRRSEIRGVTKLRSRADGTAPEKVARAADLIDRDISADCRDMDSALVHED